MTHVDDSSQPTLANIGIHAIVALKVSNTFRATMRTWYWGIRTL